MSEPRLRAARQALLEELMYFLVTSTRSERRLMAEVLTARSALAVLPGDTRLAAAMADAAIRSRPNGRPRGARGGPSPAFIDGWNAANRSG